MQIFSIAIDGPAGAGKSSVAKKVAAQLGAVYLDTGAMYRTMGLYMDRNGVDGAAEIAAAAGRPEIGIFFDEKGQHMLLDGVDVTEVIRTPEASMLASKVGGVPEVRARMVALQQEFARGNSVVMDGRDIGTVVLTDATLKVFLTASAQVRAKRRYLDLARAGKEQPFEEVLADIVQRDYNDSHRAASPMRQAEDAVLVDTSELTEEQVVQTIVELAQWAMAR